MNKGFLPTNEPVLDGNEEKYIQDCFKRNWISAGGKYTKRFEKEFAKYLGVKYAITCSNGTAAIHLALEAIGVDSGDEIIIPDFTIICSASMTIFTGAKPVLVDVDKYWCIDPEKIEEKITKRTKAIMVVHMYGNPADMQSILKIANKHKLAVIEDACAAHGATANGRLVGSIGDISCFSFYSSKNITMGEGGAVVTNDNKLAKRVRLLKQHAFEKPRFIHKMLGFNYRLTDIHAAIGVAQLERIEEKINKRKKVAQRYKDLLQEVKEVEIHPNPPWGESVFWMYSILIKDSFGRSRDEIIDLLKEKRIGSERFFTPMSKQPVFLQGNDPRYPDTNGKYFVSHDISRRGMYIPSGLNLTKKQQERVVEVLLSLRK